jgi:hypothetical protein
VTDLRKDTLYMWLVLGVKQFNSKKQLLSKITHNWFIEGYVLNQQVFVKIQAVCDRLDT